MTHKICPHCRTQSLERVKRSGFGKNLPVKAYKCRNHSCRWQGTQIAEVLVSNNLLGSLKSTFVFGLPVFTVVMMTSMLNVSSSEVQVQPSPSGSESENWQPTDLNSGSIKGLIKS